MPKITGSGFCSVSRCEFLLVFIISSYDNKLNISAVWTVGQTKQLEDDGKGKMMKHRGTLTDSLLVKAFKN